MIFRFFIIAILIFTLFRILNFILGRAKTILKLKYHINDVVSVIELATWILFVLWMVKVIYDSKNYFALISMSTIFLLMVVPLFILIRDYVTGIFLKLQNKIIEGKYIKIEEIEGLVKKAGHLRIDIEDNHGNISSVSYFKVGSKIISQQGTNQNLEKVTIELQFPKTEKINEFLDQLKKEIMNTPWVAVSQFPIIEKASQTDNKLIVEVGVFMLDRSFAEEIKSVISEQFGYAGPTGH